MSKSPTVAENEQSVIEQLEALNLTVRATNSKVEHIVVTVLADQSYSMTTRDCHSDEDEKLNMFQRAAGHMASRRKVAAQVVRDLAEGSALKGALNAAGVEGNYHISLRIIAFAEDAKEVMSDRLERRCPKCKKHEHDRVKPCIEKQEKVDGQLVTVFYCSDECETKTSEFVSAFHEEARTHLVNRGIGSETLPVTAYGRMMEKDPDVGDCATNIHRAAQVFSRLVGSKIAGIKTQAPDEPITAGAMFESAKDMWESGVKFGKNPIEQVSVKQILLVVGDDEPTTRNNGTSGTFALRFKGAELMIPTIVVKLRSLENPSTPMKGCIAYEDVAFGPVIISDGRYRQKFMKELAHRIVSAIKCTKILTISNEKNEDSQQKTYRVNDEQGQNFQVLPGQTVSVYTDPDNTGEGVKVTEVETDAKAVEKRKLQDLEQTPYVPMPAYKRRKRQAPAHRHP